MILLVLELVELHLCTSLCDIQAAKMPPVPCAAKLDLAQNLPLMFLPPLFPVELDDREDAGS